MGNGYMQLRDDDELLETTRMEDIPPEAYMPPASEKRYTRAIIPHDTANFRIQRGTVSHDHLQHTNSDIVTCLTALH